MFGQQRLLIITFIILAFCQLYYAHGKEGSGSGFWDQTMEKIWKDQIEPAFQNLTQGQQAYWTEQYKKFLEDQISGGNKTRHSVGFLPAKPIPPTPEEVHLINFIRNNRISPHDAEVILTLHLDPSKVVGPKYGPVGSELLLDVPDNTTTGSATTQYAFVPMMLLPVLPIYYML